MMSLALSSTTAGEARHSVILLRLSGVVDVRNENRSMVEIVIDRQIPRIVELIGKDGDLLTGTIENQHHRRLKWGVADQHEPASYHAERSERPRPDLQRQQQRSGHGTTITKLD